MKPPELVYVVHEWPASTQTFVEREVRAITDLGIRVAVYPLRGARQGTELGTLKVFGSLTGLRMLQSVYHLAYLGLRLMVPREVARLLILRRHPKHVLRQAKALLLAAYLVRQIESRPSTPWVHAHFFGRAADVGVYVRLMAGILEGLSVTGHAGDVLNPHHEDRLGALLTHVDLVACASDVVQRYILARAPEQRTVVVHCGVSDEYLEADRQDGSNGDGLNVLTVARLVPKKGVDLCINVARVTRERLPSLQWKVVGDGPLLTELRALAESVPPQRLELAGHLPNDEVRQLMRGWADVFVLPARVAPDGDSDGIPVALMEAMALGLPVIATPVAGIPELIESSVNGTLVPSNDASALEAALVELHTDSEKRAALGRAARVTVATSFRAQTEAIKLLQAIGLRGAGRGLDS